VVFSIFVPSKFYNPNFFFCDIHLLGFVPARFVQPVVTFSALIQETRRSPAPSPVRTYTINQFLLQWCSRLEAENEGRLGFNKANARVVQVELMGSN
jgi:hypothetical protein